MSPMSGHCWHCAAAKAKHEHGHKAWLVSPHFFVTMEWLVGVKGVFVNCFVFFPHLFLLFLEAKCSFLASGKPRKTIGSWWT